MSLIQFFSRKTLDILSVLLWHKTECKRECNFSKQVCCAPTTQPWRVNWNLKTNLVRLYTIADDTWLNQGKAPLSAADAGTFACVVNSRYLYWMEFINLGIDCGGARWRCFLGHTVTKATKKKWLSQVTIKNVSPIFVVLKSSIYIDFESKFLTTFQLTFS